MSNDTPTEPVRPTGGGEPAPAQPAAQRPPAPEPSADVPVAEKPSFRDRFRRVGGDGSSRTFGLAALLASTLAALIVGGLGGAAISAGLDDDHGDRGDRMSERHGPGGDGDDRPGWSGPGMPGLPGQLPRSPAPEDDDSAG